MQFQSYMPPFPIVKSAQQIYIKSEQYTTLSNNIKLKNDYLRKPKNDQGNFGYNNDISCPKTAQQK